MPRALSREELLSLPAAVDIRTAGRAFGYGHTKTYELVNAGQFPVKVLRMGRKYLVRSADLLDLLGIEPDGSLSRRVDLDAASEPQGAA